jgi:hypothetical protein
VTVVAELTVHPATPDPSVRSIVAEIGWTPRPPLLSLLFRVHADTSGLRLPPSRPVRRADGLWQHTCFEAFVRAAGVDPYHEFNFSTSGEWAAYSFDAPRAGMRPVPHAQPPRIGVLHGQGMVDVSVELDLTGFGGLAVAPQLELGLAAVIERNDGGKSFWALQHAADRPDFHDPAAFAVALEGPGGA